MNRRALALASVALSGALAGCGLGAGPGTERVRLTVTRDFGQDKVGFASADRVRGGETVMRLLQRRFRVGTRYGGGFVQSIEGLAGGSQGARRVDWFYYVNGIEAPRGAADTALHRGDRVWWDRHDWSTAMRVPAVVGSFPEPFRSGSGGRRLPVRIDCAPAATAACDVVERRLRFAGVAAARTALGAPGGKGILRLVVGTWRALRRDPAAQQIDSGPATSGVFARFDATGRRLTALDPQGRAARELFGGAGLVAATRYGEDQPTWFVTGTDSAGVLAAARALEERTLTSRFAVAAGPGAALSVPVVRG